MREIVTADFRVRCCRWAPDAPGVRESGRVTGMTDHDRSDDSGRPDTDLKNFAEADGEFDDTGESAPQDDELGEDEVAAIRASQADPRTPPPDARVG